MLGKDKPVFETDNKKELGEMFADLLNKMEYTPPKQENFKGIEAERDVGKLPVSIFTSLKWRFFKGKNYAWVLKCSKTGNVKLMFAKNPRTVLFGKKSKEGLNNKVEITKAYHWFGGHPLHVCIEDMPVNVPLNREIKISQLAPHLNATIIHSHQIGVLRGMKLAMKGMFSNPLFWIAIIIVVVAAGASAYFSMQALDTSKTVLGTLQSLIDANAALTMQGV